MVYVRIYLTLLEEAMQQSVLFVEQPNNVLTSHRGKDHYKLIHSSTFITHVINPSLRAIQAV